MKSRARYVHPAHSANKTGVVGVRFSIERNNVPYYRATINFQKNKKKTKSFNCNKLGHEEAFKQAVAWRKEGEAILLKNSMMYIQRVSTRKYWTVRILQYGSIIHQSSYFDATYGSFHKALKAAVRKRNEWAEKLGMEALYEK